MTTDTLLGEAVEFFDSIGREIDVLAAEEQTRSVSGQIKLQQQTKRWQDYAEKAANRINRAAPRVEQRQMELLRSASLMLSEIIGAQKPELVTERYHARRGDITTALTQLRSNL